MSDRTYVPDTPNPDASGDRGKTVPDLGSWEWIVHSPEEKAAPEAEETGAPEEQSAPATWELVARYLADRERGSGQHEVRRSPAPSRAPRLSYLPGLDGLRALAVIAVLLYHAGLPWIPGGFLGVEVFFVISGYLITALLLAEWRQRGRIDLKAFWLRRARRLLPALYLLLVVTLTFSVIFLPGEVARLRDDVLAALGYVTNWLLIFNQESYFEAAGRPSLLKHLWSLAVEEQFYLLWPPILAAGLALVPRRFLLPLILGGVVASAALMAALYTPDADPSRIYYGTDTRAAGLLVGAALAFLWSPEVVRSGRIGLADRRPLRRARRHFRHRLGWAIPRLLDLAGLVALGVLVWFCLRLDEFRPLLYQGGFALVALTTGVLILLVVHPRAQVGTGLLGRGPLRWIGLRSYGIYLWHWPVFMVTRPQLDVPLDGVPLLALRLVATVVLADLSYRFVETPIRRGALGRAWKALREARGRRRRRLGLQWAGAAGSGLVVCLALGVAVVQAQPVETPSYQALKKEVHTETNTAPDAPRQEAGDPAGQSQGAADASSEAPEAEPDVDGGAPQAVPEEEVDTANSAPGAGGPSGPVSAIGDSVMLGASGTLERRISALTTINAEIGFQAADVIAVLRQREAAGQLGDVVVVHVGNNGPLRAGQFEEMMDIIGEERRAVFVSLKVPRFWEQRNNEILAEGVERYPNAVLADWNGASADRPELFWDDGMHLRPAGERVYTNLVLRHIGGS